MLQNLFKKPQIFKVKNSLNLQQKIHQMGDVSFQLNFYLFSAPHLLSDHPLSDRQNSELRFPDQHRDIRFPDHFLEI